MADARIEIRLLGDADTKRRLTELSQTQKKVDQAFLTGKISVEQYDRANRNLATRQRLVKARIADTGEAVRRANAQLRQGQTASRGFIGSLKGIQAAAAAVGFTFAAWQVVQVLRTSIRTAAQFESQMLRVQALTQSTDDEFRKLEQQAIRLGESTVFSASESARAMGFLAQQGFKVNEIVGAMPALLNLAAAGQTDLGVSAQITGNILRAFDADVAELPAVVDAMTFAMLNANTTIQELGEGMRFVGPLARELNIPLNDTVAVLASLSNVGIQAGMAGAGFRQVLISLVAPSKQAQDALKQMGINLRDAQGQFLPLADILRQFRAAQQRAASAGQFQNQVFQIFEARAGSTFLAMLPLVDQIEKFSAAMSEAGGIAQRTAEIQMSGLEGQLEELSGAWETFVLTVTKTEEAVETVKLLTESVRSLTAAVKASEEGGTIEFFRNLAAAAASALEAFNRASARGGGPFKVPAIVVEETLPFVRQEALETEAVLEKLGERNDAVAASWLKQAMAALQAKKNTDGAGESAEEAAARLKRVADQLEIQANLADRFAERMREARNILIEFENIKIPADFPVPDPSIGARSFEETNRRLDARRRGLQQLLDLEHEVAIATAELQGQTVDAIILATQRRVQEVERELRMLGLTEEEIARATEAVWGQANLQIAQEHQRQFEQMSQQIDSFFQQVFLTARSFGDVWKQLLQQMLRLFVSMVAKMIAAWLSGMQTMRAGAGGILGTIFGALFPGFGGPSFAGGFGGQAATAATGGALPAASVSGALAPDISQITGLAPSAGQGVVTAGAGATARLASPGGLSATNISRLQGGAGLGLLSLSGLLPLLGTGGLALAGFGINAGSPVLGALGGFFAGGAAGLGLAALLGGVFSFAGPIGAIVGAVIGLLGGILSRGKKKRQASRVADEGFAAMTEVIEQFKKFEVDFESALGALNSIWDQMVAAWQQIGGKVGKRSISSQRPFFEGKVAELESIQAAREARGALEAFGIIPEFAVGGFVNDAVRSITSSQGKILAFLHQGEAVLNARAVQSLGRSFIQQANQAPGFQSGGMVGRPATGDQRPTINIGPIIIEPAPGMNEEALAGRVVRRIRRELRDLGL